MIKVLVTGGSGFLGRGILARAKSLDWQVTVLSRDEYKQDLCRQRWPDVKYVLGDVFNYERLLCVMQDMDYVIHTAAVKFIPEAELNVLEAIAVNIDGSHNVFKAAAYCGVKKVVAISTDKATIPVNVYGMTKAIMERMVGEFARDRDKCQYTACRYGNVVGSTGSVVPVFIRQAQKDHVITVTNPDMTRYWISVNDAVDLIQDALSAESGDILIPTPASMRVGDLATLIAHKYNADVKVVGERPGEKRHEQLLHQQESVRATWDGKNYVLKPVGSSEVSEPFMLSSSSPKVWLSDSQMGAMIEESVCV